MATIKITLTEDHLKLISNIRFTELPIIDETQKNINWGIDMNSLYGGSFLLEDISFMIGVYDKRKKDSEENPMGPEFDDDLTDYMFTLHEYIIDNLPYIEDLVHQFSVKGGLSVGTYKCKDYERIWKKID